MTARAAGLIALALAGCTNDRLGGPTGDTAFDTQACQRPYDGPTRIQEALVQCTSDTQARFSLRTQGWTSGATVTSILTDGGEGSFASDVHDLESFKFGACQDFDLLQRHVATGAPAGTAETNVSTEFSCETNDDGSYVNLGDPETGGVMTYVVVAYDIEGYLADCLAFGADAAALVAGELGAPDIPSVPAEVLSACTVGVYVDVDTTEETPGS